MEIKVKVKIGNVEVELSLEEAAELHAVLGRICGKPDTVVVRESYPYYVYPWPHWNGYTWTSTSGNISLSGTSGTFSVQ